MAQTNTFPNRMKLVGGLLLILVAVAVSFMVPVSIPLIAAVLIVYGWRLHKKSADSAERGIGLMAIAVGIMLIIVGIVVLLNLGVYNSTATTVVTEGNSVQ